ncbi:diguanylate cyclase [Leifsonia sp. NPDC080035]|uniref:Diguanylate cyclase n=1 Tax=Leifsonia sp. NPDC080035 TaxID=3143936 RepID=A0AAU7G766_9MICO
MRPVSADDFPCALVRLDAAGDIVEANELFLDWTGLGREDALGRPAAAIVDVPDAHSSDLGALRCADGSQRAVLVSRSRTADGELLAIADATARAEYEAELTRTWALQERTRIRLELVIEAAIAFSAAHSETELSGILAGTAARAYQAEESAVFLLDERGTFRQVAGTNPLEHAIHTPSLVSQFAAAGHVVTLSGVAAAGAFSPALARAFEAAGVHSVLVAPIRHDDELFGVFVCFFLHPRQFDNEAAPLADALAGQAAQTATSLRLQEQLEHAAMHDEVTGLPNRRRLEAQLLEYPASATPSGAVAALFIDLDGFKAVNDSFGHHAGDRLLSEVGLRIRQAVRQDDFVSRYGGDEFVVVCEVPDASSAHDVAERIRTAIDEPFAGLPPELAVHASIGLAVAENTGAGWNPDGLIRRADHAMYTAKNSGGNRIVHVSTVG